MNGTALICATTVPFLDNGDLDLGGFKELCDWLASAGISHVLAPGTTGEFTALSDDERLSVIKVALSVFGAEGLYAHVGAATARQSVALAAAAQEAGARKLAAITPYFVEAGPKSVVEYYRGVADAAADSSVYAYIFKARTTTDVAPGTLRRLAGIPGVVGVKISGLSNQELMPYLEASPPGFTVFSGNDSGLLDFPGIGCNGLVSGVANVFPELFVAAVTALNAGHDVRRYRPLIEAAVVAVGGGDIGLLKAGVALRGRPAGSLRVALDLPDPSAVDRLRATIGEMSKP